MIKAKYGDVICVNHGIYNHFGIYVDDNHVIHYDGKEDDKFLRHMYIAETNIEGFLGGANNYYVYRFSKKRSIKPKRIKIQKLSREYDDIAFTMYMLLKLKRNSDYRIYSPEETVKRARSRIGERKFNLASNNCEYFAIWCKTGVQESYQVNLIIQALFAIKKLKI